jgi:hypothetical protein
MTQACRTVQPAYVAWRPGYIKKKNNDYKHMTQSTYIFRSGTKNLATEFFL